MVVVTRPSAESKSENSRNQFPLESGHCPRSLHLGRHSHFSSPAASHKSHKSPLLYVGRTGRPPCALSEMEMRMRMRCVGGCCPGCQMSVAGGGSGDPVLGSFNHRHQQPTFTVSLVSKYTESRYTISTHLIMSYLYT